MSEYDADVISMGFWLTAVVGDYIINERARMAWVCIGRRRFGPVRIKFG